LGVDCPGNRHNGDFFRSYILDKAVVDERFDALVMNIDKPHR